MHRSRILSESLTHKINKAAATREMSKWRKWGTTVPRGFPQRGRDNMAQIEVIHESPRVIIAGRNRCNEFNGNQYAVISKATNRAVLVDMGDDWADDWHMFLEASGVELECIFFTHLHMDNLLGLPAFLRFRPDVSLAWCPAEQFWVDKWQKTCERYVRPDLAMFRLPFSQAAFTQAGSFESNPTIADVTGLPRQGKDGRQILLSQDSNRLNPTFTLAKDLHLFAVSTPGHSLGHQCLFLPHDKLLFTGDLIFNELIGRVDLPNACAGRMAQSLRKLEDFHDETVLLPGHGRITTLGWERRKNHGLQRVHELLGAGIDDPKVGANKGFF